MKVAERNRIIKRARDLLRHREETKWEICRLALMVCEIQRGGHRVSREQRKPFTLYDFADEIGMHGKTLSNWVLNYKRVVLKLNIDTEKIPPAEKATFSGAVERTRIRTRPEDPVPTIRRVFHEEYQGRTRDSRSLDTYVRMSQNMVHFLKSVNAKKLDKNKLKSLNTHLKNAIRLMDNKSVDGNYCFGFRTTKSR